MEIKYNDTFSTSHSSDDVFDFIEKDTTILKGSRNESTSLPKSTEVNSNETLSSGYKPQSVQLDKPESPLVKGTVVEVKPILLSDPDVNTTAAFAKSHTRDFYKGRSFRYAGKWELGVHYINDEYITDFVVKDGVFLVCKKSNMSSWGNEPTEWIYEGDQIIAVISDYWEVVLAGGLRGKTYIPEYDEDSDSLIWRLVNPENLPQEFQTYLGIKGYIDHSLVPIQEEIIDIKSDADITKRNVNAIEGEIINLGSDISTLEIITGSISTHVEDLEGNFSDFVQTAEGFFFKVGDLENNVGQLWLTSRQFGVQLENAEGDIARLTIEADQISTRVENAEGDISQIFQRADEISTQVENQQGDISRISQKADQIQSEVENQQGDISRITQRADIIESQVQNLDGDVSTISQRADQIQSQVENVEGDISTITQRADIIESQVQNQEGDISRISQTADQIQSQVENLNGDVSTITQRADSIESSVSNLEGDVSIISQTADEISTRVTNAEGDISTLSQTADEISSEVTNLQGDVSTISQRADEIQSQVENVEGDISNITQRADIIESQVQSQAGDISRISQTADQIQSEVSNLEGDVSTVTQRADLIESQVQDVEGDVSTISQRADSIELEVLNQQGDISDIRQTADDINLRVENAEGDIASLDVRADQITSTVADQQGQISQIRQTSEQIASEVAANKVDADNKYTETNSRITQTAAAINLEVARVEGKVDTNARTFTEALGNLQDQIDGAIDTWFYNYAPVHTDEQGVPDSQVPLNVVPYSDWVAAETAEAPEKVRDSHVSDIFYDQHSGYAYRFIGTGSPGSRVYTWVVIQDAAVIKALEDAARAQDTADHKRRVFVTTPYAPYDLGDLWVKSTTVGNVAATELYRCIIAKTTAGTENIAADWAVADSYAKEVSKSNIQILADAIVQQTLTYTYDEYGRLSKETKSAITTGMNDISLAITGSKLETVGIFIRNANTDDNYINLIADKVRIKGTGNHTPTALSIVWDNADSKYKIDVASLNVNGIFTTSAWNSQESALHGYADDVADDALDSAKAYANSRSYLTGYVLPLIQQETSGLAVDSDYSYLKTALENQTTALGGLMLTSLIQLGATQSGSSWAVNSGISGIYDSTKRGNGIAAWFGGPMVDHLASPSTTPYAASLFRMDGSGYLAGGEIQWGASGELIIHGTSAATPITIENAELKDGNKTLSVGDLILSIQDLLELKSWFTKEEWDDSSGTHYYLKLNASGTGIEGFVSDGFISAGGLSNAGGASGIDLDAMWQSLKTTTDSHATDKIAVGHIPDLSATYQPKYDFTIQGTSGASYNLASFVTSSGVTSIATGTGLTGGPITSTGTISINSTYQTYIANGNTAYGWGNHANAGYLLATTAANTYLPLTGGTMSNTNLVTNLNADLLDGYHNGDLSARYFNPLQIDNTYDANSLSDGFYSYINAGNPSHVPDWHNSILLQFGERGRRGKFQFIWSEDARSICWRGGTNTGVFTDWYSFYHSGNSNLISVDWHAKALILNGSISGVTTITASGLATVGSLKLSNGTPTLTWDSSANAWHLSGNFYADGFISAGGLSPGGGTGGIDLDAMWASLTTTTDSHATDKIAVGHIPDLSGSYLPLTGGILTNSVREVLQLKSTTSGHAGPFIRFVSTTTNDGVAGVFKGTVDSNIQEWFFIGIGSRRLFLDSYSTNAYIGTDSTRYAIYHQGNFTPGDYLSRSGGTMTGAITVPNGSSALTVNGGSSALMFGVADAGSYFGQTAGTTYLRSGNTNLQHRKNATDYVIYDESNLTKTVLTTVLEGNSGYYVKKEGDTMSGYLIWTGTAQPSIRMNADTDNAKSYIWENTSGVGIARITFMNTQKAIYINSTGANAVYSDAVGKYSLKVGENSLTYNTYSIYHTNNLTKSVLTTLLEGDSGYYVKKAGDLMTGGLAFQNGSTPDSYAPRIERSSTAFAISGAYNGGRIPFVLGWRNISTPAIYMSDAGYVGVNTSTPSHYFEVDGSTYLSATTFGASLEVHRHQSSGNSVVKFSNLSGTAYNLLGYVGIDSAGKFYFSPTGTSSDSYIVRHTGNFVAGTDYVSISGTETITGAKTFTGAILAVKYDNPRIGFYAADGTLNGLYAFRTAGTPEIYHPTVGWKTIYHAGNSNSSTVAWACSSLTASGVSNGWTSTMSTTTGRAKVSLGYFRGHGLHVGTTLNNPNYYLAAFYYNQTTAGASPEGTESGNPALYVRMDGNVGIGTGSPSYKLDVDGTVNATSYIISQSGGIYCGPSTTQVRKIYGCDSDGGTYTRMASYAMLPDNDSNDCWQVRPWNGAFANAYITVYHGGNVNIGTTTNGGEKLYVAGNIVATGAVTAGSASDARLKTNINTMSDAQAKALIMALRPVTFTWNQKATELYDQYKGNDFGFVAQEVEGVQNTIPGLSKAIGTIFENYKRLDPVKFIAPIVKVEQDHERRIHELEKAVKERDKKIEELEKRLNMN